MTWMLDPDTVSFALRGEGRVAARLRTRLPSEIVVSSLTVAELSYGVEKRRSKKLRKLVATFLAAMELLPFDAIAASRYGLVAASLVARGRAIGLVDTMIAAHALATKSVLVSHNTTHFRHVSGLKTEDWY